MSVMKAGHGPLVLCLVLLFMFTACAPQPVVTPFVPSTPTPTSLTPEVTGTPSIRSLRVCLGEEPNTLYPLGNLNSAARSVLSAIYDGPMDVVEYGYEPIILEKVPDGDVCHEHRRPQDRGLLRLRGDDGERAGNRC